ncbi:MAG: sensor histidine kinase [Gemmatimonadaceae bacterium]|nr:sensor histidine kinase [Gemmatimonadaceae bacterium]
MTTILTVPPSLDDVSFESLLQALADLEPGTKPLVDARHTRWASPYGLVGLLTLFQSQAERPQFIPPEDPNTASYWARSGFFRHAEKLAEFTRPVPKARTGDSNFFLEVTPIAQTEDVQHVVAHIQERSAAIMETLGFPPSGAVGFSVVLSESCQNIIEHAGGPGWVAVQTYDWQKRLGRRVVVIAVSDSGLGFRQSLEPTRGAGDRWDDGAALEAAVLRATSRFHDPGRGQGIAGIRRYVGKWQAKFTVRSGTARIGIFPEGDEDPRLVKNLPPFPGAQMQIVIPQAFPDA